MLGPIGYSRLMHPRGELAASAAAGRHGTAYILSTLSGHRIEDVKAQSPGPTFYQLYLAGGRGAAEGAIARAKAAGYKALFVTIDTPVGGQSRARCPQWHERADGLQSASRSCRYIPNILAHPRWLAAFIADGMSQAVSQHRGTGIGTAGGDRCGGGAGIGAGVLDRSQMDPRSVGRSHCDEGRDDGRRRQAFGRSWRAGHRGLHPCRPPAGRRAPARLRVLPGIAGSGGRQDRGDLRRRYPPRRRYGQGDRAWRARPCFWGAAMPMAWRRRAMRGSSVPSKSSAPTSCAR